MSAEEVKRKKKKKRNKKSCRNRSTADIRNPTIELSNVEVMPSSTQEQSREPSDNEGGGLFFSVSSSFAGADAAVDYEVSNKDGESVSDCQELRNLIERVCFLENENDKNVQVICQLQKDLKEVTDMMETLVGKITKLQHQSRPVISDNTAASALKMRDVDNNTTDDEIEAIIEACKCSAWPIESAVAKRFAKEDLTKLRLHKSTKYGHLPEIITNRPCKLCFRNNSGRKSSIMCGTCKVALCTKIPKAEKALRGEGIKSHFDTWHEELDLELEHEKAHDIYLKLKGRKKEENVEAKKNLGGCWRTEEWGEESVEGDEIPEE